MTTSVIVKKTMTGATRGMGLDGMETLKEGKMMVKMVQEIGPKGSRRRGRRPKKK